MDRTVIPLFLALIFTYGCVRVPIDEAKCQMLETPCISTQGFAVGEFPCLYWWEMFNDSQLNGLIAQALSDSPTLSRVAARVEAAEAEANIKKSRLFPTIGYNASVNWQYIGKNNLIRAYTPKIIPGKENIYAMDIDLKYEIDFWGKNRNTYRAALGLAKAEMAEQQTAILILTTSVASIYFKLQAELEQLAFLQQQREIFSQNFSLTQLRQEHALDSTSQLLDSDNQLLLINQNIQFSIQCVELARHMLNMLIGQGPDLCEHVQAITLNTNICFPLPCDISSDLISRRPDLMAQIWRIESAAHLVGAAKAEFYPSIDLFALFGLNSVFANKFFSWGSRLRQVNPALHLPIFTGGRLRANLREKRAEFEQMIYSYNESVLKAVQEVADQIVILRTTNESLKIEEDLLQNKSKNRNFANDRYKNAIESLSSYLDVENDLIEERITKIILQYQQRNAVIQLIRALGGGYCSVEAPLG